AGQQEALPAEASGDTNTTAENDNLDAKKARVAAAIAKAKAKKATENQTEQAAQQSASSFTDGPATESQMSADEAKKARVAAAIAKAKARKAARDAEDKE
ncbi:MAG: electron transport complex subunit RsxC, partial [Shewanella sp.]|nr:electron transport complex subunit RsxC [Shewanella sp.]